MTPQTKYPIIKGVATTDLFGDIRVSTTETSLGPASILEFQPYHLTKDGTAISDVHEHIWRSLTSLDELQDLYLWSGRGFDIEVHAIPPPNLWNRFRYNSNFFSNKAPFDYRDHVSISLTSGKSKSETFYTLDGVTSNKPNLVKLVQARAALQDEVTRVSIDELKKDGPLSWTPEDFVTNLYSTKKRSPQPYHSVVGIDHDDFLLAPNDSLDNILSDVKVGGNLILPPPKFIIAHTERSTKRAYTAADSLKKIYGEDTVKIIGDDPGFLCPYMPKDGDQPIRIKNNSIYFFQKTEFGEFVASQIPLTK